jgi:hypothetical protein
MAKIKFKDSEIKQVIDKEEFTENEVKKAAERDDMSGVKTKTMKLHLDKLEDRLLAQYLEDKSFTETVWRALKIYKKHFDAEVLLQEKLDNLEKSRTESPAIQQVQPQQPQQESINTSKSDLEEADDSDFVAFD